MRNLERPAVNGKPNPKGPTLHSANVETFPLLPNVVVGRVRAVIQGLGPLVDYPGNVSGELVSARSMVKISDNELNLEVVLVFEDQDGAKPLILGILQGAISQNDESHRSFPIKVQIDDDRLLLSSEKEIVLRCGKSSITLTKSGKVLIEGESIVSDSTGVNRIRGGSVQLN